MTAGSRAWLRLLLFASLFVVCAGATAAELRGVVSDEDGLPVSGATVLLTEPDLVAATDDEGRFAFPAVAEGSYELRVFSEGFEEYRDSVELPSPEPVEIVLHRLVVDMGEITVEAGPEVTSAPPVVYSKEQMERISTGGDPLGVLPLTPGVLGPAALDMGYAVYDAGRVPQAALAVRGLNPLANTFYFDYMRAPTLQHLRGLPMPRSAIPTELTESVEVLRGGYGVEHGPGYGGIFLFKPDNQVPEAPELSLRTSLLNLDLAGALPLGPRAGLQLSARKSLYELTWEPLITALEGPQPVTPQSPLTWHLYGEGDYVARLVVRPNDRNLLSLDFLGLIDYYVERPLDPIPEDQPPDRWIGTMNEPYNFHAQGFRWSLLWGDGGTNTTYVFDSIADHSFAVDSVKVSGAEASWFRDGDQVRRLAFGDSGNYSSASGLGVSAGLEASLIRMLTTRDSASTLGEESHRAYTGECQEASGYAELRFDGARIGIGLGARGDYFSLFNQLVPSVRGDVTFRPNEALRLSISGGTYPGTINYLEYLVMSDRAAGGASDVIQERVSSSLYAGTRVDWQPTDALALASEAYVNWLRGLSGYDPQYQGLWSVSGAAVPADEGLAWGVETACGWTPSDALNISASYEYGWARYRAEAQPWRPANFDVSHTIRGTVSWKPRPALLVAANLRVLTGFPFTPFKVTGIVDGQPVIESGDPNSARDWVPAMALDVRLAADLHLFGGKQVLFVDVANLLAGPVRSEGDPLSYWVGMNTRRLADRSYRFPWWGGTVLDFGLKAPLGQRGSTTD